MTAPLNSSLLRALLDVAMPGRELLALIEQLDDPEGYAALGLVSPVPGSTDCPILVLADREADTAAVTLSDDEVEQLRDALDEYLDARRRGREASS